MRLKNKIAIITGAAQGIGLETTKLFAANGAIVLALDINLPLLMQEANKINLDLNIIKNVNLDDAACEFDFCTLENDFNYKSGAVYFKKFDVKLENDWIAITNLIKDKFNSKLDILFNNAGIAGFEFGAQDPENCTLDTWKQIHEVNLDSIFLGCKYAISLMKENKSSSSIINMSSRSGLVGIPLACAYASSKAAILNHTKSVALYCASQQYDIRVNNLCPAAILAPMWDIMLGIELEQRAVNLKAIEKDIPIGRIGQPIEVAYAALFLASNESAYITGSSINIDGGILAGSALAPRGNEINTQ